MDGGAYQTWLEVIDDLSEPQRAEVQSILAGGPSEAAEAIAALEGRLLGDRVCPHCQRKGAVCRGRANGLRRFLCRGCGKTFNALTGTPLANLHHRGRWFDMAHSLSEGESVRKSAARCDVAVSTAFRWRHRFLRAIKTNTARLGGIVEADETYVLESRKGSRAWKRAAAGLPGAEAPERKPRKRGGKATKRGLSGEQVPVLVATDRTTGATISAILPAVNADTITDVLAPVLNKDAILVTDGATFYPPCAVKLGITHEALNQSAGERVRGELHIQTVNSRHERLKTFLRRYRGISTKYLDSYIKWFHLAGLRLNPPPRTCLNAAMGRG
jgi:transposase-like protein